MNKQQSFTLIELLVVIGIIGILTAILLPAISGARAEGKKTSILGQVKRIDMAIERYWNEYDILPFEHTSSPYSDDIKQDFDIGNGCYEKLSGDNPRELPLYSGKKTTIEGKIITIYFDSNYDGKVVDGGRQAHARWVIEAELPNGEIHSSEEWE